MNTLIQSVQMNIYNNSKKCVCTTLTGCSRCEGKKYNVG